MPIEDIKGRVGAPRAKATCDECGREEVVPCFEDGLGQVRRKLVQKKWRVDAEKCFCPSCEAKRRAKNAVKPAAPKSPSQQQPVAASAEQKRQIYDLLNETYDIERSRFFGNETDETVASVVPGCRPGWVAQVREEFFGPAGGNEDMATLGKELDELLSRLSKLEGEETAMREQIGTLRVDVRTAADRLRGIERAVGPRQMARVA